MPETRSPGRLARWRKSRMAALLLGLAAGLGLAIGQAQADKVGVAAAVNPDAFSSLSQVPNKQLNIGKSIFYDERINTSASGLVQVLLIDGSTFTVGPNSDLVIDRFVYDPRKKTGEMVATFSKGTMRFIGGKLSKNAGGVTVKTPQGVLAIRGGMVQGSVHGYVELFSFLFGEHMTFTGNDGQTHTVYQTGYTLHLTGNGGPIIRPTTPQDTNSIMQALNGGNRGTGSTGTDSNGSNPGTDGAFQAANNQANNTSQQISDANIVMVQTEILSQLRDENETPSNNESNNPPNNPPPNNPPSTNPPPPSETEYHGYGTGIVLSDQPLQNFSNIVSSTKPSDLVAVYNSETDTTTLAPVLRDVNDTDGATSAYVFGMTILRPGEVDLDNPNLDDFSVLAHVFDQTGNPYSSVQAFGFAIDGDEFGLTGLFPETFGAPQDGKPALFCTDCNFFSWGANAVRVEFSNAPETDKRKYVDHITNGWWIAGDLPTFDELPTTGNATYDGHTIGTVVERAGRGESPHWDTRLASGDVHMMWDFAQRSGQLDIIDFDKKGTYGPLNVSGPMSVPGKLAGSEINRFSGPLNGTLGSIENVSGHAFGSFARRGSDPIAGVIGDWHVRNQGNFYKATGIFGASRAPNK